MEQLGYSLSIGYGCFIGLASYNKKNHNCFRFGERKSGRDRDACMIVFADSFMSIFGGTAVFATPGFLARSLKKPVKEVVKASEWVGSERAQVRDSSSWPIPKQ